MPCLYFGVLILLNYLTAALSWAQTDATVYTATKDLRTSANDSQTNITCTDGHCTTFCSDDFGCTSVIYTEGDQQCLICEDSYQTSLYISSSKTYINFTQEDVCKRSYLDDHMRCRNAEMVEACLFYILQEWKGVFRDCQEAFEYGKRNSGDYFFLKPSPDETLIRAICQFDSTSGWTVIQRRLDGSVDFDRYWDDFVQGFGELDGEYWLGLESIHRLTRTNRKLSVYLEAHDGENRTGNYSTFYLDGGDNNYTLHVSGYSGDAGSGLTYHDGMMFSARDRDNDLSASNNCAVSFQGAWWHNSCRTSNLNGLYYPTGDGPAYQGYRGATWGPFKGQFYSYKTIYIRISR